MLIPTVSILDVRKAKSIILKIIYVLRTEIIQRRFIEDTAKLLTADASHRSANFLTNCDHRAIKSRQSTDL